MPVVQATTTDGFDFFDLSVREVPVGILGKRYLLREASEGAAARYRNAMLKATKLGPDGKPISLDGMADAAPLLVSLCLFEVYEHQGVSKDRPVLLSTVVSWPSRVVKPLFEKAKEISELDEDETEETLKAKVDLYQHRLEQLEKEREERGAEKDKEPTVKNGLSATTPTST